MAAQEKMNVEEFRQLQAQQREREDTQARQKFGNIITEVDGIRFHSFKESKYYGQCKIRKMHGEIVDFEMQKPFDLEINGQFITTYIADFVLKYPDGKTEVIDVKSKATASLAVFRIKKAMMFAIHGIKIIEK